MIKLASNNKKEETVKVHLPTRRLHGVISRVSESVWKKGETALPLAEPLHVHCKSSQKKNVAGAKSNENIDLFHRDSVNSIETNVSTSHRGSAEWDESSFSNVYKPYTVCERGEEQYVKPLSLEASYELLKQQEQGWKIKAKRFKEEADEKTEVVEALKKKIAELVVKLQDEQRSKIQEQERYKSVKGDFEELTRNFEWNKKQLHECQVARDRALKEMNEEKKHAPKSPLKLTANEECKENVVSLPSVKEFTAISHPAKVVADELPYQSSVQDRLEESQRWAKEEKAHWEAMVAELEGQVESWKKEAGLLSEAVTRSEKERATWLGRIAELQKRLEEGATDLEGCKGKLKESECKLTEEEERRRVAEGEREELRAALNGALKEKTMLDGAVECIRNDFERVRKSFELMKSILAQREKELADMKEANGKREAEIAAAKEKERAAMNILDGEKVVVPQDSGFGNVVDSVEPSDIQHSKDLNDCEAERKIECVSKSSIFGTSPCCLAAMERVDLEWRQKHKSSIRALIKKLNQKQRRLMESENSSGDILDSSNGNRIPLSKTISPFALLPVPSKFSDTMIMQLIGKGKEVIERSNICSMDTLKSSLVSLEGEVSNLEDKIRLTFPTEQKMREIGTVDIIQPLGH